MTIGTIEVEVEDGAMTTGGMMYELATGAEDETTGLITGMTEDEDAMMTGGMM